MLLSVAIREGSKKRALAEKGWSDIGPDGGLRVCPLLAAAEAYGLLVVEGAAVVRGPKWMEPPTLPQSDRGGVPATAFSRNPDEWVAISMFEIASPCACKKTGLPSQTYEIVQHLYDVHRWSGEELAAWVEKAEEKLDHKQWVAAKGPDKPWTPGLKW